MPGSRETWQGERSEDKDMSSQEISNGANRGSSKATLNAGRDDELTITGFGFSQIKATITGCFFVATAGLLWLFLYWMPRIRLRFTHDIVALERADTILVEVIVEYII